MSEVLHFAPFAASSKGLLARPILPRNVPALQSHIQSISYAVHNLTDGGAPVTGNLVVATVMQAALQPWTLDSIGYSFLWAASGTLWPLADKSYRILVTFTTTAAEESLQFTLAWQADTSSPTG